MTSYDDIETLLQEWFSDGYAAGGIYEVAKLYAFIQVEMDRQLQYFTDLLVDKE